MEATIDSALLERLQWLLDRQDIQDCILRYTRGMDRLDKDLLLSAYHPDALDHHGLFLGNPQEFWDYHRKWHLDYNEGHHHSVSNINIEIDGDIAHTETYWLFESINRDASITLHGGRYLDRFEKRHGEWKIAARACIVEWHGSLGEVHLEPEFAAQQLLPGVSARDRSDRSYERPLVVGPDRARRDALTQTVS